MERLRLKLRREEPVREKAGVRLPRTTTMRRGSQLPAGTAQRYGFVTSKLELTIDASVDCAFTLLVS